MDIYDKIYYYFKNNKLISHEVLLDYAEDIISKNKLDNIINCISINSTKDSGRSYDGNININPYEILLKNADKNAPDLDKLLKFNEKRTGKIKNKNLVNIYNLFVINHELIHAYQTKLMNKDLKDLKTALLIKDELLTLYDVSYFNNFYYNKYHDYFYKEYDANINGYYNILYLINKFNIKEIENLLKDVNYIIAKNILYLYSDIDNKKIITTPVKNMKKLYDHVVKTSLIHNKDLRNGHCFNEYVLNKPNNELDKLKLGISINKDTYKYIKNIANKKIKTLNLFKDIKRPNINH